MIVCAEDLARQHGISPVMVDSIGGGSDIAVLADRPDPLVFRAVRAATARALDRANVRLGEMAYVDIASACTIAEILTLESLEVTEPGQTGARCKEGFGRVAHARVVNPGGAAQGRGLALGTCGIVQAREAFLQLGAGEGIQHAKGFIQQQNSGFDGKSAGNTDSLLHALRKVFGFFVQRTSQSYPAEVVGSDVVPGGFGLM